MKLFTFPSDQTITLTVNNDTATANVFTAPLVTEFGIANNPTLNAGDNLTGKGTNPTLNAVLNGQVALAPTMKGIETANFTTAADTTFRADNVTGLTKINHLADIANADLIVRNLANNADITVDGAAAGSNTDIRFLDRTFRNDLARTSNPYR